MPHTHAALSVNVAPPPFWPPHRQAGLRTGTIPAHWSIHRPLVVTLDGWFGRGHSAAGTDHLGGSAGKDQDADSRLPARSRNPAKTNVVALAAGGTTDTATGVRVLVVEDDVMIGTLLAEMLAGLGHNVCAIEATEAAAVKAAARCKPDLMIVDVALAEGNGIAAVEKIYRAGPIPHVFVSGDVARVRALRPASIFMQKPYRESDLVRVIQQALDDAADAAGC